jgi:PadR family transcriptional regulator, regulatory protein AphA
MQRSLGWVWPRAISRLYEEPKKLAAAGLAVSRPAATGGRRSTVYSITAQGRRELAAWLAEPGAGITLECEALVKIAYADQGTREGLLANLDAIIDETSAKLQFGDLIARSYLEGRGPFQDRLAYSGLMWRFLWDFHLTVLRWAQWAKGQVEAWPDDIAELDATAEFGRIVAAAGDPWTGQRTRG